MKTLDETRAETTGVTRLLRAWRDGDAGAMDELMPLVYDELRRLAGHYMSGERSGHTLQPTALIHEAWLRLAAEQREVDWESRAHFVAVAATMMRRVLMNHVRDRQAQKRGEGNLFSLEALPVEIAEGLGTGGEDLLALDEALEALVKLDQRLSRIVELRLFGGFTVEETARYLELSSATVKRDFRTAKAFLKSNLGLVAATDSEG